MTRLYLVRHAHAGDRASWDGPDEQRPLSEKGWRQARRLVTLLADEEFHRITSSPSLRCVQTVVPLAEARAIALEEDARLHEGSDPRGAFDALVHGLETVSLAACTHGDLMPAILELAASNGAVLPPDVRWPKGCTWILDHDDGRWRAARYQPPPSD
jgi:broad specificity phosphatase PhoE